MPKDLKEDSKKKMVVVEEVVEVPEKKEVELEDADKVEKVEVSEETSNEIPQTEVKNEEIQEIDEEQDEKPNYLWIIIPTALLIGALVGGLITYFSGLSKLDSSSPTPSPVSSEVPVASPTPTAEPATTLKKEDLKIQILNGSGVSGAAGKAKTLLEAAGYKSIDTGNATVSNLAQTEIEIKVSKKEYLEVLTKDLEKSYAAVEAEKPLVATSKYDLVITIGKK